MLYAWCSFIAVCDRHVSICEEDSCPCHSKAVQVYTQCVLSCSRSLVNRDVSFACTFISMCSLDPEQKEQLTEVIEKLLKDQTTVSLIDCCEMLTHKQTHTHTHSLLPVA